jgi:hypothetical protein
MMVDRLNLSEWKYFKNKQRWELRIKETRLFVGAAYIGKDTVDVYAFFHDPYNTYSERISLPVDGYEANLHNTWRKCMEKILNKTFL